MILDVKDVFVSFRRENQTKLFGKERQSVLNGVSFSLSPGESLALVGESGSGKSTLGRVVSGLLRPDSGSVEIDGEGVYDRRLPGMDNTLQNKTSIVFQDYTTSVNPRFRVGKTLKESLRMLEKNLAQKIDHAKAAEKLLEQVGLPAHFAMRYPHELSGGQLQRVCIARAIAIRPELIILDEAVSSLDASTQTQIMDLLIDLRKNHGFSYLFITHDLTAVTYMCDRVMFFKEGMIVERVNQITKLSSVKHEYARRLLSAVIELDGKQTDVRYANRAYT